MMDKPKFSEETENIATSPTVSDSEDDSLSEIECEICDKTFWNVHSYEQHVNSKKHYNQSLKKKIASKHKLANELGSDDDENLNSDFTELKCVDCSLTFTGYKPYVCHIRGSTHAKNLKKKKLKEEFKDSTEVHQTENDNEDLVPKPIAHCKLCFKSFLGLESYKQHLHSALHKRKLKEEKILESLKAEHSGADDDDEFFNKCDICDKSFSGIQSYNVHMKSSVHQKSLKKIEMEKVIQEHCTKDATNTKYICKECKKPFTDPFAFKSHLDNNSHKKYETKSKILEVVNNNPDIVAVKTVQNADSNAEEDERYRLGDYVLVCKMCHTSFSGPESAIDHVNSKKHIKVKEEKAKKKVLLEGLKAQNDAKSNSATGSQLNGTKSAEQNKHIEESLENLHISAKNTEDDFELI